MPIHKSKMDVEYTAVMWIDAGVGVVAQHIFMKYCITFLDTILQSCIRQSIFFVGADHGQGSFH